jgi:hypothetical protein
MDHAPDETRYRERVTQVYNRLSLTGLPERDPRLNELPLADIFVKLSLDVARPEPDPIALAAAGPEGDWAADEARKRLRLRQRQLQPPAPVALSVPEALRRHPRLVLVGAPGSGKTMLLRWLAVTFAQDRQGEPDRLGAALAEPRLPVLLELRRFVDRFGELSE